MSTTRADSGAKSTVKPRPAWLKALGSESPPASLEIDGEPAQLVETFKHDSWAATALYAGPAGSRRIVKLHRRSSLLGLPMSWLGRRLARHERRLLGMLADLPGIPALKGTITDGGRPLRNAVARDYIEGHPLGDREAVSDPFFHELAHLLRSMHRRRVVYVDLHKRENILVDMQGRPCLIDFQISLLWPRWLPTGWIFQLFRRSDEYHLMKHWSRCRPDQCGIEYQAFQQRRPWWIRAHRLVARPIRELRRKLLVAVGVRTGKGRVESELFAEHALRKEEPTDRRAA
jgi:serine/threonine protein kinase